jgi:hypothetical protein
MPLYQIKHLQALETYLELMGVSDISKLPAGKGRPPQEDPQVFLGGIILCSPFHTTPSRHPPSIPANQYHQEATPFFYFLDIFRDSRFFSYKTSVDTSLLRRDILAHGFDTIHTGLDSYLDMHGIQHPRFTRFSETEYTVSNPVSAHRWYVHVGQIKTYLAFDKHLRDRKRISNFPGVPLGYSDFVTAFNTGAYPQDERRLCEYTLSSSGDHVKLSNKPVFLRDFHITREQCGLAPPAQETQSEAQQLIVNEFAVSQALNNQRKREGFNTRERKRQSIFTETGPYRNKGKSRRFNPTATTTNYVDRSRDDPDLEVFDDHDHDAPYDFPAPINTPPRHSSEAPVASTSSSSAVPVDSPVPIVNLPAEEKVSSGSIEYQDDVADEFDDMEE